MKELLIKLAIGPVWLAAFCLLGMPFGYYFGFIASCIVLPILAIVIAVKVVNKLADEMGVTAMIGAAFAILVGLATADGFENLRELHTGDFVRDVSLADLPHLRSKDRLTLRDGEARGDLDAMVSEMHKSGPPSERTTTTFSCDVFPIVPAGWTQQEPVRVWRFGDSDYTYAVTGKVFHPAQPDDLCRRAIDKATAKYHLTTGRDAVYLEAKVSESADTDSNKLQGPFGVVFLGGMWIVVVLFNGAVAGVRALRERKRRTA